MEEKEAAMRKKLDGDQVQVKVANMIQEKADGDEFQKFKDHAHRSARRVREASRVPDETGEHGRPEGALGRVRE